LIFTSNANSFEGVRESINIQRGDLYAKIIDYKFINIVKDQKVIYSEDSKKDQGHQMSIVNSYDNVSKNLKRSFERKYIVLTGYFFLKIDESLRKNKKMNISEKEFLLFYNK
jgi:putative NADH-flavin reductase